MKVLITGGTGFIGQELCRQLVAANHELIVLSRQPAKVPALCGSEVRGIANILELTSQVDAVVNLAGAPIVDKRWSPQRKQLLRDSRIRLTRDLVQQMKQLPESPKVWINSSAVGYYGDQGDINVTESTIPEPDFAQQLCADWEDSTAELDESTRICVVRIGLVVGPGGGFLKSMLLPFKLGLGGRLGSGSQWMSWIHRDDLVNMVQWLLTKPQCHGAYNGTAPRAVRNREFTKSLAACLHRPAWFPVPAFVLRLAMGEMAGLLLTGQKVIPKRALDAGFDFKFPRLEAALRDVIERV